jgi:hypothetical protein
MCATLLRPAVPPVTMAHLFAGSFADVVHGRDARILCLRMRIRIRLADTIAGPARLPAAGKPQYGAIPWYLWCMAAAAAAANIGAHWDISWHRSIGRDTFRTPSHLMIYLCGVLAVIASGYLILANTFRKSSYPKGETVRMWGFRGPIGAILAAWGCVAMFTSVPFGIWWSDAYGLDVKIMSPPHVLLMAGLLAVQTGALVLLMANVNRAKSDQRGKLTDLCLYIGSMILIMFMVTITEFIFRPYMHQPLMYRVVSLVAPAILAGLARATGRNWAATFVAAGYSVFYLLMLWILPLFPAEPGLGPVFTNVNHMVPLEFPLLLVVPAIVLDALYLKIGNLNKLLLGPISGVVFLLVFMPVQWQFATFLQSPEAGNWFFGAYYVDFKTYPDSLYALHKFIGQGTLDREFDKGVSIALACAIVSAWVGLAWGDWMRRTRR